MYRLKHILKLNSLLILFAVLFSNAAKSQVYPVQTNISTAGPYYNYLSYYADENNHLQAIVTLTDFNSDPIQARLRITIEGPGYDAVTNPNIVVGNAFTLEPGVPNFINGIDLAPYLLSSNLLVTPSGIDLNNLPSGFTTICVDVIRDGTNQEVLSTNNCTSFFLQRFQPPQAVFPVCASNLNPEDMFYTFQWSPPVGYVPAIGTELDYTFSLYEWNDPNNYTIFQTGQGLVYTTQTSTAVVQLSEYDVLLQEGTQYVWRVEAQITSNGLPIDMIENNGVSEPCTFMYGASQTLEETLADGLFIELNATGEGESKGNAYWTVIDNTPGEGLSTYSSFLVSYRKKPTGNESFELTWLEDTVTGYNNMMYQLEDSTTYEVFVQGIVGNFISEPSETVEFTTLEARVYACGEADLPYLLPNYNPLSNALVGMRFQIGQFTMQVTEITPNGAIGHYSGKGLIPIAFLAGAKAKVRFDDILVDDQYVIREGQVDVVTKGLDNWLFEQYMQFIDPIYVDGTIDSAYVENGVAWVVVNGESLQFEFDPPEYPVIINDENGNQYTIWPDGTIEVGTYLVVSDDYLDVGVNDVATFVQNNNENFGFDGKEHMQWHENYEVIQLNDTVNNDSSYYFVANKSIGEGESDVVDVVIPASANSVTVKLDGSTTLSGALSGNTITIPDNLSNGKHAIYIYSGPSRIGKLNVQVYSKKEKEVVFVPLTSGTLSQSEIEIALAQTFGEANIDVKVTIASQWNDSVYTTTKLIEAPTDVGLLSKYSDDMRGLRDAYFDSIPSDSINKNAYYIFVVPGFSDNETVGYMVRGRALGFIKTGVQPHIYAHELAHGIGALQHSWDKNGPARGTTTNLMDYSDSLNPISLTKFQWKEMRDMDIVPSLFDDAEDAMFQLSLSFEEFNEDDVPLVVETSNIIPGNKVTSNDVFKLKNGLYFQFEKDELKTITTIYTNNGFVEYYEVGTVRFVPVGYALKTVEEEKENGEKQDVVKATYKSCIFACQSDACKAEREETKKTVYDKNKNEFITVTNVLKNDHLFKEYRCGGDNGPTLSFVIGIITEGFDVSLYKTPGSCPSLNFQAFECKDENFTIVNNYLEADFNSLKSRILTVIADNNKLTEFVHFPSASYKNSDYYDVIEERYRLLRKLRPNYIPVIITFRAQQNNSFYSQEALDKLAEELVKSNEIISGGKKIILHLVNTNTYDENSFLGYNDKIYECTVHSYAVSDKSLMATGWTPVKNGIISRMQDAFKYLKKPYYIHNIYEGLSFIGEQTISNIENGVAEGINTDISGLPFIAQINAFQSVNKVNYDGAQAQLLAEIFNDAMDDEYDFSGERGREIREYYFNLPKPKINEGSSWVYQDCPFHRLKESVLLDKDKAVSFYMENQWVEFAFNLDVWSGKQSAGISPNDFYTFDAFELLGDPIIYGVADVIGFIPVLDVIGDAIGTIYSAIRGNSFEASLYSAAIFIPVVNGAELKASKNLVFTAKKGAKNLSHSDLIVKEISQLEIDDVIISNKIPVDNISINAKITELNKAKTKFDLTEVEKVLANAVDDVLLASLRTKFAGKTNLLSWLDDIADNSLLTKLDELSPTGYGKLDIDLGHNVYGPEIKTLLQESPDDLTNIWKRLKDEPAYSWEIKKTGGSRWEKWGQREFFKNITKKGKDFEELICKQAFRNRSSAKYLELKQKFQADFGKNLDDYDMFSQVQLKYNSTGDYFVADQVFVKYDAFGDVDDLIVLENKLSSTTPFSPNQTSALQSNSFTVRSNSIASDTNPNLLLESANNETLSFSGSKQWYKVSSSGDGASITNIQKVQ